MRRVEVTPGGDGRYRVAVDDGGVRTSHDVGVPDGFLAEVGGGHEAAVVVRESFAFLLDHEPASSILAAFDLPVISRYFPGYLADLRRRLG